MGAISVQWITADSVGDQRVSLFSLGNYTYVIDVWSRGAVCKTYRMLDTDFESALRKFAEVRDSLVAW